MKTTLDLDDELLLQAKRLAVRNRSTLTAVVEDALREILAKARSSPQSKLSLPTVRGQQAPHADPADRAAVYDLMEPGGSIS